MTSKGKINIKICNRDRYKAVAVGRAGSATRTNSSIVEAVAWDDKAALPRHRARNWSSHI